MKRKYYSFVAAAVAIGLLTATALPASADDPEPQPTAVAPSPGDPTTSMVAFSSPVSFDDAVTAAASYSGTVVAIHYDNPEVSGEYSFGSGQTPAEFETAFNEDFGTTPAATALVVATTVPTGTQPSVHAMALARNFRIQTAKPAFLPRPATFSAHIKKLTARPKVLAAKTAAAANTQTAGDWRADQADAYVTSYTANRVDISTDYWWLDGDSPALTPSSWGVEFEVNMKDPNGDYGVRGGCHSPITAQHDPDYKKALAAQNQNWNWKVIRPDGVTALSNLGAYPDYNDLGDPCNQASFAIGLRYPQNIQYVNGAYGIVFDIDAPKGLEATSVVSGGTQAVYDGLCNVWPYSVGPKTDCMGALAGSWPLSAIPHATGTLSSARGWLGPKRCWFSASKGTVAPVDQTSWC